MSANSPTSTFKSLPPFEQGILVTGVLAFIVSFFPWYGFSFGGIKINGLTEGGGSYTISAWHSYSTLALLLSLAATVVAAIVVLSPGALSGLPIGSRWLVAGLSVLAVLLELLRLLTLHHGDGLSIKWGGYLLALVMIANAVCAVISALSSDQAPPWQQTGAATPPAPPAV
ncbi:MAG TPA: hypothetical protein VHV79_03480 [Mycobacteriales bacterium]|nr:hypothetical protein [Mycobacteriales bacterium]